VGNGWLKIINSGRFALSLYDKYLGNGFRVFLAPDTLENWPEIKAWFFKLNPKPEQNHELLLSQIKEAGEKLFGIHPVQVRSEFLKKLGKGKVVICPSCKEAYPLQDGNICRACQGRSSYIIPEYPEGYVKEKTSIGLKLSYRLISTKKYENCPKHLHT